MLLNSYAKPKGERLVCPRDGKLGCALVDALQAEQVFSFLFLLFVQVSCLLNAGNQCWWCNSLSLMVTATSMPKWNYTVCGHRTWSYTLLTFVDAIFTWLSRHATTPRPGPCVDERNRFGEASSEIFIWCCLFWSVLPSCPGCTVSTQPFVCLQQQPA